MNRLTIWVLVIVMILFYVVTGLFKEVNIVTILLIFGIVFLWVWVSQLDKKVKSLMKMKVKGKK